MATTANQRSDFITNTRNGVDMWLAALDALRALKVQADAQDMLNQLTPADFTGENEGLTAAQITAVYTTLTAENALQAQGHATNLYTVARSV